MPGEQIYAQKPGTPSRAPSACSPLHSPFAPQGAHDPNVEGRHPAEAGPTATPDFALLISHVPLHSREERTALDSLASARSAGTALDARTERFLKARFGGVQDALHAASPPRTALPLSVQAKLEVGAVDDPLEREADAVAERVMRMTHTPPSHSLETNAASGGLQSETPSGAPPRALAPARRKCEQCEEDERDEPMAVHAAGGGANEVLPPILLDAAGGTAEARPPEEEPGATPVQTKRAGSATPAPRHGVEERLESTLGGGQAISASARRFFEPRFGHDFSRVHVHADAEADALSRDLGARAFTVGHDIYFRSGAYDAETSTGRSLIAHELTHVLQQTASSAGSPSTAEPLVQRQDSGQGQVPMYEYSVRVPESFTTLDEMFRLFERTVFGRETNFTWNCRSFCDMSKNKGKVVPFFVPQSVVTARTDPDAEKQRKAHADEYGRLPAATKKPVADEADRRYYDLSGDKPGTKIRKGETGKSRMWEQKLDEVMKERELLDKLSPAVKELLMGRGGTFQPKDYRKLLEIARKLATFSPEDLAVYKLLVIRATDNLDLFEKSVDMFLARKAELTKAVDAQASAGARAPSLKDAIDEKWKGLDEGSIGKMSESERYALARQKTSELTEAQLKYMKDHPGETLKEFAKSATLANTPETFSAIGKDLSEAARGDANSWARSSVAGSWRSPASSTSPPG
jgi:hypothetical protein